MQPSRRDFCRQTVLLCGAIGVAGPMAGATGPDLSRALIDSMITRYPDARDLGVWTYYTSLYLMGIYMVFIRTGYTPYLKYIQRWVDSHVDAKGNIDHELNSLDYMQPGNLLLMLYTQTHQQSYLLAIQKIHERYATYPRTKDGGFWHSASEPDKVYGLWLDGTFMGVPFLLRYARIFGGEPAACNEAAKQLLVDYHHNWSAQSGLLYHAYDESGQRDWARPVTHTSSVFWGRAIGWYAMTLVDTLGVLPKDHPQRPELLSILQRLVAGLARYQDAATGLWYQIIDQPHLPGNWLETSSSSMFTYTMDVAVKRGYIERSYRSNAARGYAGVLTQIHTEPNGLVDIDNICEGTGVGDTAFYLARKRNRNDPHGLGAFLLMNEEWNTSQSSMAFPK